jgi:ubiquinone/menaquinone biosynthesis C-methylase UbiE
MTTNLFTSKTLEKAWLKALRLIIFSKNTILEDEPFIEMRNLHISYTNAFEIESKNYINFFGQKYFEYINKVFSPGGDTETGRNYYDLIYKQSGTNQIKAVIKELKRDPLSRSAIIVLATAEKIKKPCITEINFSIRNNFLNMSVIFKSSDFAKKFIPDMTELSKIHKYISSSLHVPRGEVAATIFVAQVYLQDIKLIQNQINKLKATNYFKTEEVAENWDREAEEWDKHVLNPNHYVNFEDGYSRFLKFIDTEIPKIQKKSIALDSGCGTGIIADKLNKKGYDVIGIDISPRMLMCAHKGSHLRKYIHSNSLDIPYEDDYFDLICSRGVLISHVGKKYTNLYIQEHKRVLKKGSLFIFDFITKFEKTESKKSKKKASMDFKTISDILIKNGFEVLRRSGTDINRVNAILCKKV